ncbi:Uncharacterised protein [Zhongshania aliphaticivorans]|uniref:Lysozyme inhibitor LprI-like N-terminal domain-containing protein n=1 Tax=Zhongshania aliphaticivorans TaxID=1470434 RepID=A0A5S9PMF0_9GAMM|nr:lysozyme inhibitor LprI family protein [Zhongshania aliphaticivorans]CAA0105315.1 Uncharacterised protein [Zhongshania aliphaticivorans]CAA0105606.1 Uncharacterised protein [Zhongshania aliphaticivorans]
MMLKFVIYSALSFVISLVHASDMKMADNCTMSGSQADMTECAAQQHHKQKVILNNAFEEVLAIAKSKNQGFGPQIDNIQSSQNAWEQYAEQDCQLLMTWGGSIASMQYHLCMTEHYKQRQKSIQAYICHPALGPCTQ